MHDIGIAHWADDLMHWAEDIDRDLPWKSTTDPYKIWISEIILQQTQVSQGKAYYLNFIQEFPTIEKLANAEIQKVLKVWQGLGYYSRARHLHKASIFLRDNFNSKLPSNYTSLRSLPGIGDYTAGAILSFAFDLPFPAIDSNVIRFISRLFGIFNHPSSKQNLEALKSKIIPGFDTFRPSLLNQALIDFGALMCTPSTPKCSECPFNQRCYAYTHEAVAELPVKKKKIVKRSRYFHYFMITDDKNVVLNHRDNTDIWRGLTEFPLIETEDDMFDSTEAIKIITEKMGIRHLNITLKQIESKRQLLTHQIIHAKIYHMYVKKIIKIKEPYFLADRQKVSTFAFPKILTDCIHLWVDVV